MLAHMREFVDYNWGRDKTSTTYIVDYTHIERGKIEIEANNEKGARKKFPTMFGGYEELTIVGIRLKKVGDDV